MFNLYLCEVAIVSQLFIPSLFSTWDCVKITPLATNPPCDYASKSCSTRGRYRSIVGVTSWYQSQPRLRSPLLDRIVDVVESRTKCFES